MCSAAGSGHVAGGITCAGLREDQRPVRPSAASTMEPVSMPWMRWASARSDDCPNSVTPRQRIRSPRAPERNERVCGCPSSTLTSGTGDSRGNSSSMMLPPVPDDRCERCWNERKTRPGLRRTVWPCFRTPSPPSSRTT